MTGPLTHEIRGKLGAPVHRPPRKLSTAWLNSAGSSHSVFIGFFISLLNTWQ